MLSLLQSPAETPTSGRPPTGPQGQLLRDVFGDGNMALRQSPFGGFTAVEQGESIKHLGPRISLTPARSGPVDGASDRSAFVSVPSLLFFPALQYYFALPHLMCYSGLI